MPTLSIKPQIIIRDGKPSAVILGISRYEALLEAIEDKQDLAELHRIKKSKTSFKELKDYLKKGV